MTLYGAQSFSVSTTLRMIQGLQGSQEKAFSQEVRLLPCS